MPSISVLNTDAGLSGKTIANTEDAQTVTGLKTFDRDPNPPFAVSSGSAVVTNLDADKLDGVNYASASYTPTVAGISGATISASYAQIGKRVTFEVTLTGGTGSGTTISISLPVTAERTGACGSGVLVDAGVNTYGCIVYKNSTSTVNLYTIGAGDTVTVSGSYIAATAI
jgi:hypothetical protein